MSSVSEKNKFACDPKFELKKLARFWTKTLRTLHLLIFWCCTNKLVELSKIVLVLVVLVDVEYYFVCYCILIESSPLGPFEENKRSQVLWSQVTRSFFESHSNTLFSVFVLCCVLLLLSLLLMSLLCFIDNEMTLENVFTARTNVAYSSRPSK